VWEAHCIDAWCLAHWWVGGKLTPDNIRLLAVTPLHWYRGITRCPNGRPTWTTAFSPPWISPACPRSFRIRAGYLTRFRPREHTGWNVPPLDQRKPHHLGVYAHLHTGLASDQRGCPPGCFSHPACSWTGRGIPDCRSSVLLCHQPVTSPLCHGAKRRTSPSRTCVLF
jgi:hypothetical protein